MSGITNLNSGERKRAFDNPEGALGKPPKARKLYSSSSSLPESFFKEFIPPMPPTPVHFKSRNIQKPPFSPKPEQLEESPLSFPILEAAKKWVTVNGRVRWVEDSQGEICMKQPIQTGSCGLAALVMLLDHHKQTLSNLELLESFWQSYTQQTRLSSTSIVELIDTFTNISNIGYEVEIRFYTDRVDKKYVDIECIYSSIQDYHKDLLAKLKGEVDMKGSLIVSISNEEISGHWILIDKITGDKVFIRDPFTGQAYQLEHQEMFDNWKTKDAVQSLAIVRSNSNLG